jgi:DNA-binding LytR/AlgR family response regulator
MPGLNGMEIAREVRESDESVIIVFITAAPQYAISGYQVQALSYLLKPVPWFAFKQEMKRSIDMIQQRGGESMLVETRAQQLRLELSNVVFLESIRHTIVIHTLDGKLSITSTLKELETQLAQQGFFRSNACYLVNLRHVQAIEDQECIMSNGEHLRVSRPRKKMFLAALADFLGAASR